MTSISPYLVQGVDTALLRGFIKENPEVLKEVDADGLLPIHQTVFSQNYPALKILIECGADPHEFSHSEKPHTILTLALTRPNPFFVSSLLADYPELLTVHPENQPHPISIVTHTSSPIIWEAFTKALFSLPDSKKLLNGGDGRGCTPLHWAAHLAVSGVFVSAALQHGADPLKRDTDGFTALHRMACSKSSTLSSMSQPLSNRQEAREIIRMMMMAGLEKYAETSPGKFDKTYVKLLLLHRVDPPPNSPVEFLAGYNMVHLACAQGNMELLMEIIGMLIDSKTMKKLSIDELEDEEREEEKIPSSSGKKNNEPDSPPLDDWLDELSQSKLDKLHTDKQRKRFFCMRGTREGLELLIKLLFIDTDSCGKTALFHALKAGDRFIVGLILSLIPRGAPERFIRTVFFGTERYGRTLIHAAAQSPVSSSIDQLVAAFNRACSECEIFPDGVVCSMNGCRSSYGDGRSLVAREKMWDGEKEWRKELIDICAKLPVHPRSLDIPLTLKSWINARVVLGFDEKNPFRIPDFDSDFAVELLTTPKISGKTRKELAAKGCRLLTILQFCRAVNSTEVVTDSIRSYVKPSRKLFEKYGCLAGILVLYTVSIILSVIWCLKWKKMKLMLFHVIPLGFLELWHIYVASLEPGVIQPRGDLYVSGLPEVEADTEQEGRGEPRDTDDADTTIAVSSAIARDSDDEKEEKEDTVGPKQPLEGSVGPTEEQEQTTSPGTLTPTSIGVPNSFFRLFRTRKICPTCYNERKPKTKHCPYCNRCVMGFDHCCPWIGNDVGVKNHRKFCILLILGSIIDVAGFVIWFIITITSFKRLQMPVRSRMGGNKRYAPPNMTRSFVFDLIIPMWLMFWHMLIGIWCIMLLTDQLSQIVRNKTTNEIIKEEREKKELGEITGSGQNRREEGEDQTQKQTDSMDHSQSGPESKKQRTKRWGTLVRFFSGEYERSILEANGCLN